MAVPKSSLTTWAQYLAARMAVTAVTMSDVQMNLARAAGIGRAWYNIDLWAEHETGSHLDVLRSWLHRKFLRHRRTRALRHLAWAFPEKSLSHREQLARRSFEHLLELAIEILYTPRLIHHDSWPSRVGLGNLGPALDILCSNRPKLLITGHLGNWEVLGYFIALLGFPIEALARPIDNPLINRWLLEIRQRRGLRVLTKWNATDRMVEVLRGGGALGFIADQNAGDKGIFVPFFGHLASTYKSIGLLAITHNAPMICGYALRQGSGYRYELDVADIIHPEDWSKQPDPLYYITARYSRAMEMMIRQSPAQYLWMHRRWKSRPRHERLGKPMPASLQRNLESLPWMEQTTLDRLKDPMPTVN